MSKRIIFPSKDGGLSVLIPAPGCELPIEVIAAKDVPFNTPFKIIDEAEVPSDRTFRGAWEADFSRPDGFGADYGVGSVNDVLGYDDQGNPNLRGEA